MGKPTAEQQIRNVRIRIYKEDQTLSRKHFLFQNRIPQYIFNLKTLSRRNFSIQNDFPANIFHAEIFSRKHFFI